MPVAKNAPPTIVVTAPVTRWLMARSSTAFTWALNSSVPQFSMQLSYSPLASFCVLADLTRK